jgi:predicted DNA-binding protein
MVYSCLMDETLSIKVPKAVKLRLKAVAKARKVKPSVLLREALDQVLSSQKADAGTSCYELCQDLFEQLEPGGPRDLSTNKKYFEDFGK